jgi:hypothetical protein
MSFPVGPEISEGGGVVELDLLELLDEGCLEELDLDVESASSPSFKNAF